MEAINNIRITTGRIRVNHIIAITKGEVNLPLKEANEVAMATIRGHSTSSKIVIRSVVAANGVEEDTKGTQHLIII